MRRLLPLIFLSACATAPAPGPVQTVCLPLKTYTPAEQAALAKELATLPPADPIVVAMTDYGAMRAADRACIATTQPPPKP